VHEVPHDAGYSAVIEANTLNQPGQQSSDSHGAPEPIKLDYSAHEGDHRAREFIQRVVLVADLLAPIIASSVGYEKPIAVVYLISIFAVGLAMSWYLFRYSTWTKTAGLLLLFYAIGGGWILIAFGISWFLERFR
jgi:hypothetical protein